jgi:small subunit ribosomal protein S10
MKIRLTIKSFQKELIQYTINNLAYILEKEGCRLLGTIFLPEKIKKFCVLTSPHIDKDSREHLEIRIKKCILDIEININNTNFESVIKTKIPDGVFCTLKFI